MAMNDQDARSAEEHLRRVKLLKEIADEERELLDKIASLETRRDDLQHQRERITAGKDPNGNELTDNLDRSFKNCGFPLLTRSR